MKRKPGSQHEPWCASLNGKPWCDCDNDDDGGTRRPRPRPLAGGGAPKDMEKRKEKDGKCLDTTRIEP